MQYYWPDVLDLLAEPPPSYTAGQDDDQDDTEHGDREPSQA